MTPKQIPIADIIAQTEATARKMDALSANQLRAGVSEVLKGAKPPNSNLSGGMWRAVKSLKQDESIAILPADKGNATVVLDRMEYDDKLRSLLGDGDTYRKIPRNPTARMETKVTRMVKDLADKGYITDRQRVQLAPQYSTSPQISGLPKIHKESVPLRPIISTTASPTYRVAKELARILSPLVSHTESFVKNSSHFVQGLGRLSLGKNDRKVRFDVVSLFTRVPIDEALQVISSLLHNDESLRDRTSMPPDVICEHVEFCLRPTYFQVEDGFFEQLEGAAMGSSLSPIVANLFMESFERRALQTAGSGSDTSTTSMRYGVVVSNNSISSTNT